MPRRAEIGRTHASFGPLCAVVLLAACSGGGGNPGADPPAPGAATAAQRTALSDIDPCTLVTRAEAQAIVGPGPAAKRARRIQDTFCSYSMENGYLGVLVAAKRFSKGEFQTAAKAAGGVPIAGLGDAAFWRSRARSLYVLKGSLVLRLDLFANEPAAALREAATGLAENALPRISPEQAGTVLTDAPDERPTNLDVCALLRASAARALVGAPASAERFTEVGYVGCHWSGANGFVQASLLTKDYSRDEFDAAANGGRALRGLGDYAFARSADGLADVAVLEGSAVLTVRVSIPETSQAALLDAARSLAAKAAARI